MVVAGAATRLLPTFGFDLFDHITETDRLPRLTCSVNASFKSFVKQIEIVGIGISRNAVLQMEATELVDDVTYVRPRTVYGFETSRL